MAEAVTLLPHPDSPTSERVCPFSRENETSEVTSTGGPVSSAKPTESPLTSRSRLSASTEGAVIALLLCTSRP